MKSNRTQPFREFTGCKGDAFSLFNPSISILSLFLSPCDDKVCKARKDSRLAILYLPITISQSLSSKGQFDRAQVS
ncbi:hypothetical protein ACTXT7_003438 [Hymenolepis weldensis]